MSSLLCITEQNVLWFTVLVGVISSIIASLIVGWIRSKLFKPWISVAKELGIFENTICLKIKKMSLLHNLYDITIHAYLYRKNEKTKLLEMYELSQDHIYPHEIPILTAISRGRSTSYYILRFVLCDKVKELISSNKDFNLMVQISAMHGQSNLKSATTSVFNLAKQLKPYPYKQMRSLKLDKDYFENEKLLKFESEALKPLFSLAPKDDNGNTGSNDAEDNCATQK